MLVCHIGTILWTQVKIFYTSYRFFQSLTLFKWLVKMKSFALYSSTSWVRNLSLFAFRTYLVFLHFLSYLVPVLHWSERFPGWRSKMSSVWKSLHLTEHSDSPLSGPFSWTLKLESQRLQRRKKRKQKVLHFQATAIYAVLYYSNKNTDLISTNAQTAPKM